MKKSDTEQEQPGLKRIKFPTASPRNLTENYRNWQRRNSRRDIHEERRRERHERNLKRKKRQIRNRNLALIITALAVLGGDTFIESRQG
ncbi:MAG: hypothetical protein ACLRMZ_27375 [Blautia marasmi]